MTWQPEVMTHCDFLARFFALRSLSPVTKCNALSNQTAAIVVTCGRPFGRTVANQYVLAVSSCRRAFSQGVGVARSLLYRGSNSPTGIPSALARSPPVLTLLLLFSERRADRGHIALCQALRREQRAPAERRESHN